MAADILADARTGKNGRHALVGLLRQSVFGRLAGVVTFGPCRARPLLQARRKRLGGDSTTYGTLVSGLRSIRDF